ncbi:MAG: minor capsid protein [Lachnospiraceae bacterium]|nr:minor capsid protein [Lachnospiraceae bacterium]
MSSKSHRKQVEYWKRRETKARKNYIKDEKEYKKQIDEIYDYMMDNIQKEIDSFYRKYAKAEGISMAEAKKRVSELDIKAYERKAKRYVKNKDFSKEANEEMRLYNATMKINRLEMLKANIGLELVDGFDELQKYFDQALTDRTLKEFERQAGILGKTVQNNAKMAHSIVNASFHNATFSDRIWMHQDLLKVELDKLLRKGMIQGKNPRELARSLNKTFQVGQRNAERLMITEMARVQTDASFKSMIENGFTQYKYLACGYGDVCDTCKVLDGKVFNISDGKIGENAPPMHPHCHCTVTPYMDRKAFDEWLDSYKEHGLDFEEWNRSKAFAEKEKSKRKYKHRDTAINASEISSAGYRRKFTDITGENKISRSLWENALDMLEHRSGTKYEDLAFIDSKTGKSAINKNYDKESTASPSKKMRSMLKKADPYTIIAIHNHPGSSAPSYSDIMACRDRKYKYGLIVCHDGKIYKYFVDEERLNIPMAVSALDRVMKKGYTEITRKECLDAGINLEVF